MMASALTCATTVPRVRRDATPLIWGRNAKENHRAITSNPGIGTDSQESGCAQETTLVALRIAARIKVANHDMDEFAKAQVDKASRKTKGEKPTESEPK